MTEPSPIYETQDGGPRSSPTATVADTGNGESAAPTAAPDTVAPSTRSRAAKSAKTTTGNGRGRGVSPLDLPELLQIWQQATYNLQQAGLPVSALPLPNDVDGRPQVAVVLANVRLDTGNLILATTADTGKELS